MNRQAFVQWLFIIAMAFTGPAFAKNSNAYVSGFSPLGFSAPHHAGRMVKGAIWYPSDSEGPLSTFAENGVFYGVKVQKDAPIAAGKHPVVLLSHGLGGHIRSLAWLAAGLAQKGAVVVSVNHPNSTWGDFDMAAGTRHWTRVWDLSRALDAVLSDARLNSHLDTSRIMAAGFSYGGWTALSMGGLRGNLEGYAAHCKAYGTASRHCLDLQRAGVSLDTFEPDEWNASYADSRVTQVVAVEPGLIWGLQAQDVSSMVERVTLISLGRGDDRLLATNFDASGLVKLLPKASIDRLAPATHFTALPLCKPMGAAILEEDKDDPVCSDPKGTDRAAVHAAIVETIAAGLGL